MESQTRAIRRLSFLDLPAEIRNQIYGYACEDAGIILRPPHHIQFFTFLEALMPSRVKHVKRFFGLTQVCRQVRREFLPLYLAAARVWVRESYLTVNYKYQWGRWAFEVDKEFENGVLYVHCYARFKKKKQNVHLKVIVGKVE